MGNSAGKEFKSTELLDAAEIPHNEALSILPSLVSTNVTRIESKGKKWITSEDDAFLWASKQKGMIKSHCLLQDEEKNTFATLITVKTTMNSIINYVCKSTPSFEGQEPLTPKELKKAGIDEGTTLYPFSKIDTKRKMTTATSTYSIVTGKDTFQTLYTGEKLSAMGFMAVMKEGDKPVAKAQAVGLKMKPVVESAIGVDLLAVVLMGYTLVSNESSAGALAGAGVI